MEYLSHSVEETEAIGETLAGKLSAGSVVAYRGTLGMGKTAFVRGMAQKLSPDAHVSSPTFALVNDYGGSPPLVHFDMYRISGWDDLDTTGFFEYQQQGAVLAVEWSENIENALPEDKLIRIEIMRGETDDCRILRMSGDSVYEDSWR